MFKNLLKKNLGRVWDGQGQSSVFCSKIYNINKKIDKSFKKIINKKLNLMKILLKKLYLTYHPKY